MPRFSRRAYKAPIRDFEIGPPVKGLERFHDFELALLCPDPSAFRIVVGMEAGFDYVIPVVSMVVDKTSGHESIKFIGAMMLCAYEKFIPNRVIKLIDCKNRVMSSDVQAHGRAMVGEQLTLTCELKV